VNLALICVGGGRSERYGSDKLSEQVGDRTVLEVSVGALRRAFPAAPLIIVVASDRLEGWRQRLAQSIPEARLLVGGKRRQDSVRAGVEAAAELGADVVAVHDAARPLVDSQDIKGVVWALGSSAGAVLCSRISDTVKRIDSDGFVDCTLPRDDLRLAQTPQVFRVSALFRAWQEAGDDRLWTDEASMLESMGMPVRSVLAQRPNPKLTTEDDLQLIRALLRNRGS
jgi:2-C-methyl-D-erythritol 4-phosphate cytidylyltransferase